jgi:hypothetical protein
MHGVILTGASRGLGLALTHALLADGAKVVAISRSTSFELTRLADSYPEHLQHILADLADSESLPDLVREAVEELGRGPFTQLTLINNAGMVTPIAQAGNYEPEEVSRAVTVNLLAPIMFTDGFLRLTDHMKVPRRVINLSSGAAITPYPGWGVYGSTKAAIDQFSRTLAVEQAQYDVKVVAIYPGVVDTGMQDQIRASDPAQFPNKSRFDELKAQGQLTPPDQAARQILDYLASPAFGSEAVVDVRKLHG